MGLCLFMLGQNHKELGNKPRTLRLEHLQGRVLILPSGQAFGQGAEILREEEGSRR